MIVSDLNESGVALDEADSVAEVTRNPERNRKDGSLGSASGTDQSWKNKDIFIRK